MLQRKLNSAVDYIYAATSQALVFDDFAWEIRHERLKGLNGGPLRRLAFQAIHHSVRLKPDMIRDILVYPYEKAGFEVLGIGKTSTVIRSGDTALKVMRGTSNMPYDQKVEMLEQLRATQDILLRCMGRYAVRQEFEIANHPLNDKEVIAAKQPVIEGYVPVEINNHDSIVNLNTDSVKLINQFSTDALDMARSTKWVPDLLGASNFGFDNSGRLVLIDTLPLNNKKAFSSCIKYLDDMAVKSTIAAVA